MAPSPLLAAFARAPWPGLFLVASGGMAVSFAVSGAANMPTFCSNIGSIVQSQKWLAAMDAALLLNSPLRLIGEWALMLFAMMPPLLAMPLMHVWRSSAARRRGKLTIAFVLAYAGVWMALGPLLMCAAFVLAIGIGSTAWPLVFALALIWSASPWQRQALNRAHRLRRIGMFGWRAYADAFAFGASHASWCVSSCWLWMLLPLVSGSAHQLVMPSVALIMLAERLTPSERPAWRLPTGVKKLRDLVRYPFKIGKIHG